mmetsp:Transcript_34521/g.62595  ORF Transcript_34521/g.62595 Transcript_34521/m.62595 type:complete len:122 (-) Transcript_34521:256-621(-)|eukprot:CAMPEP_0197656136 /NCGR_PEP_ID=MMETSP1338-20131121/40427_1 /TAXON_ID=43686 ORGANISM="Pelagodinium beii, Strain RCC1491" /NCGR_SAMPLE_ID=MMETSP1338 /ASSEMBLY_ACC=CAM_ASM_000754 /LENGTH=121 /DNA_ID=CAMNT_0043231981 /DNA_START=75 /DNA_END=440 /DNA_ORIENTATION=+
MAYGAQKGLTPAMQGKYWNEIIFKEGREHLSNSLNTVPHLRRNHLEPLGNDKDFYNNAWCMMERRYDQGSGKPSLFVENARRYVGLQPPPSRPATGSRPVTGSVQSFRSRRSVSTSQLAAG